METKVTHTPHADRHLIRSFVEDFYTTVRKDVSIGPIFDDAIGDHWDTHFEILTDFWMTVLYGVPAYKGNPFLVHTKLERLQDSHFDIWLSIFEPSAHKCLTPTLAAKAIEKAGRIAASLRQGLFFRPAAS
ncbi:group III truncated hemoglobin [Kordiimonas pumila]|uniref:Group III truncated hemoglobin n=1 Tax=Kordiimonas pumila TaxID=2161677 RepID=A0ABV7CZH2_9PROT|nr:group III truncated hemoglobin [Kordiimonas pumila]